MRIVLCLLTLNAAGQLPAFLQALGEQSCDLERFLVIDSSSDDATVELLEAAGCELHRIARDQFNHGGTRRLASELCAEADLVVFMTQDAHLADRHALQRLVDSFGDPRVGAAYGRQLPRPTANAIEAHARLFNYPEHSRVKSQSDIPQLHIKAAFISNSFAAYRLQSLREVGGFPESCLVSEDTLVAAKMLQAGWNIAYCAEACVYHSHHHTFTQEFQRYFDIGAFHHRQPWILEQFGAVEGEGGRFVRSELKYLWQHAPGLIPSAALRTLIKYLGFRAGLLEMHLPLQVKRAFSMQSAFWGQESLRHPWVD
ncbi:MAG: rhamnosyltransferase [Desulfuromonas sp.]|nr:MAG: rhamnosyltransferase [Desulfuromonas sp.]